MMSDAPDQPVNDEVEGHGYRKMDTEAATEDDAEGHLRRMDTDTATEDDVEGHRIAFGMDSETATEDDVQGHGKQRCC